MTGCPIGPQWVPLTRHCACGELLLREVSKQQTGILSIVDSGEYANAAGHSIRFFLFSF